MRRKFSLVTGMLLILLCAAVPGFSSDQQPAPGAKPDGGLEPAPAGTAMVISVLDPRSSTTITIPLASTSEGDRPVALVNGEKITVDNLRDSISGIHEEKNEHKKGEVRQAPKIDFMVLLERLINGELIIQEARAIGLDELPEVQNSLEVFRRVTLRGMVREDIVGNAKADDAKVEKLYREMIREVKTDTAFFEKKEDAKKAVAAIKAGKSFDEMLAEEKRAGTIKGSEEGKFMKVKDLSPSIASALSTMKAGSVSPVTEVVLGGNKSYFAVLRLDEERYPESPDIREQARRTVLSEARTDVFDKTYKSLSKKYAKINTKLLKSLNYDPQSGPGLEKLMADKRIVAEIKGDKPVTVAELSAGMQEKFFHGMKRLKGEKLITTRDNTLEEIVQKRVLYQEALKRGIDKSGLFSMMYREEERDALFGAFMSRVVVPGVKMQEEDLKAYYHEHAGDYLSAVSMRMGQLVFAQKPDALSALERLRKGADFNWVKTNAEGQAKDLSRESVLFDETFRSFDQLPLDVQASLAGAQPGEFRLYESEDGTIHVLHVKDVLPSRQYAFEEVRGQVRQEVFAIKLNAEFKEWTRKLKEAADIQIYLLSSKQ
jgi:hypothetical protein